MPDSVQNTPSSASVPPRIGATGQSAPAGALANDFETFLTLLTSQLRNQDPLKPLDSTEFVAQLASFSVVEQQVNTNKKLDELLGVLTRSGIDEAARLIGKNVDATGAEIEIEQAGEVPFSYALPEGATGAVLRIQDSTGSLVRELALSVQNNDLVWDGKDTAGVLVPSGRYEVNIQAVNDLEDIAGGEVEISGIVEEARIGGDEIALVLDSGLVISPADVRVIRAGDTGLTNPGATNP